MRPWVLHKEWGTKQVPYVCNLDVAVQSDTMEEIRDYDVAWCQYIQGNVVSRHAQRIIVQFMTTCCGRSSTRNDADAEDKRELKKVPPSDLALQELHKMLDSQGAHDSVVHVKGRESDNDESDSEEDARAKKKPQQMQNALRTAGELWRRDATEWTISVPGRSNAAIRLDKRKWATQKSNRRQREQKPEFEQAHAYCKMRQASVKAWWQKVRTSSKPPNAEQEAFLKSVIARCEAERTELSAKNDPKRGRQPRSLSEPTRDCLLGIPGAGKSHCIDLIRDFFESCLGWEHGIQFQFLATQNSMAELIGGGTVHSWAGIPANKMMAAAKSTSKEVDWDALFENCISMRFIIIDECSTLSPGLLATLDQFLRKACVRHPYAYRGAHSSQNARLFGGINIIFCGDLWQLPPVKDVALFSDPRRKQNGEKYDAGEQRIHKMFWQCNEKNNVDKIGRLFELHQTNRCKDPWLQAVLMADRAGQESWEMYCFTHGLPTAHPGTWMPSTNAPTCGSDFCKGLSYTWNELCKRGVSWNDRQSMECEKCHTERERRCCILSEKRESDSYRRGDFTAAPFVHPFRSPTNYAQELRALEFAREQQSRVLWVIAHDEIIAKDKVKGGAQEKQQWLLYSDRRTAGIPGFFPCVLNLPVRFTAEPEPGDRTKGVFTNARGILRGWDLPEQEQQRIDTSNACEVALQSRPQRLYIEMRSKNINLDEVDGRRVYTLRQRWRTWYKDGDARQVEIQRCGFPLVPDFAGTAHMYCGTSLDACIGDLLEWHERPQRDGTVRGYIIKSRVRETDKLLLAQPYCPNLFRMGAPRGPNYLLQVLQGKLSFKVAMQQWDADVKKDEDTGQSKVARGCSRRAAHT